MKNKKRNIKIILGFIVGLIIPSLGIYRAATLANSNQVSYKGTDVKAALDELYAGVDNEYFDYATAKAHTSGKILASKKGVCISRDKKVYCFKANNFEEEQTHIQQVFSDVSCDVSSYYVFCNASDFHCFADTKHDGVGCIDQSDHTRCEVSSDGFIYCD